MVSNVADVSGVVVGHILFSRFDSDHRCRLAGLKVLKHDGSQHHGAEIVPTIRVSRTRTGIVARRDEVLERGILAVE